MNKSFINKIIFLLLAILTTIDVSAQSSSSIMSDINSGGKVNVSVPTAIIKRNNNEIVKKSVQAAEENVEKKEAKSAYDDSQRRQNTTKQTIQGRKVGFRIQVLSDNGANGKANAQARARAIAMRFPQYRSYISFNAPSWRLRIGDFKDQSEASAALSRMRAAFPSYGGMSIVKDNVNVWSR